MSRGQDKKEPRKVAEMDPAAVCKMCGGWAAVSAAGQKEASEERACKPESAWRQGSFAAQNVLLTFAY
jgi:hypothetical protein